MNQLAEFELEIVNVFNSNIERIVLSTIVFLIVIALIYSTFTFVEAFGTKNTINEKRTRYTIKLFSIFFVFCFLIFLSVLWGINYKGVLIFASSIFTVIGIALFATWSVLSNIVSSVIIFFSCPYKIGDWIKIVDGNCTLEGKITDINFYNVILEDGDKNIITYPNNVILQKAVIKKVVR